MSVLAFESSLVYKNFEMHQLTLTESNEYKIVALNHFKCHSCRAKQSNCRFHLQTKPSQACHVKST